MKSRIMYIECKGGGLTGDARFGRVTFSKTGKTLYYGGRQFQSLKGGGFKSNYFDVESGSTTGLVVAERTAPTDFTVSARPSASTRMFEKNTG